jgi:5-methylcytosine-specific restriction endonuclease McrA
MVGTVDNDKSRLKLDRQAYGVLRRRVLDRDGWRCQVCGSTAELHVHHLRFRSRLGSDTLDNLIVLCVGCHRIQHCRRNQRTR